MRTKMMSNNFQPAFLDDFFKTIIISRYKQPFAFVQCFESVVNLKKVSRNVTRTSKMYICYIPLLKLWRGLS